MRFVFDHLGIPHKELTLFVFDDYAIPFSRTLYLTLLRPRQHSEKPVMRPGKSGSVDAFATALYGTVLHIDGRYRMWYTALPTVEDLPILGAGRPGSDLGPHVAYAESTDGIHWEKPNLGLKDWRGRRDNNLVGLDAHAFIPIVLHDEKDPNPNHRYKMFFTNHGYTVSDGDSAQLWLAYSLDGLHWQIAGNKGILDQVYEPMSVFRFGNYYWATGQRSVPMGDKFGKRFMVNYRSPDGIHWLNARGNSMRRGAPIDCSTGFKGIQGHQGEQVHLGAAIWNRGNVLVGLYGMWHGHDARGREPVEIDLGLVVSNDAVHFREPVPDFVMIPSGGQGDWTYKRVVQANAFISTGDETWVWYSGAGDPGPSIVSNAAVGLAMWGRDRLGYLSAEPLGEEPHLLTAPIDLEGQPTQLFINAEGLGPQARLVCQLVDDLGNPFPGSEPSGPLQNSGLREKIVWPVDPSLRAPDGPVRLKVSFTGKRNRDIKLYALYLSKGE